MSQTIDKSSYCSYNKKMKAVGVKILKNQLSKYLTAVKAGEIVLVTEHDEVIAEIRKPTRFVVGQVSRLDAFLNELEIDGQLVRARNNGIGKQLTWLKNLSDTKLEAADLVSKMRDER